jgi:hypothetical protein
MRRPLVPRPANAAALARGLGPDTQDPSHSDGIGGLDSTGSSLVSCVLTQDNSVPSGTVYEPSPMRASVVSTLVRKQFQLDVGGPPGSRY